MKITLAKFVIVVALFAQFYGVFVGKGRTMLRGGFRWLGRA